MGIWVFSVCEQLDMHGKICVRAVHVVGVICEHLEEAQVPYTCPEHTHLCLCTQVCSCAQLASPSEGFTPTHHLLGSPSSAPPSG